MNESTNVTEEMTGDVAKLPMEVRALFASFQRKPQVRRERRTGPRRRRQFVFPVPMHVLPPDGSATPSRTICVHTRDRCDACISFLADQMLEMNALVVIDFTTSAETASLGKLQCRIRRCRQFREGWFECLAQFSTSERKPQSTWQRFKGWLGETSGFGPDSGREAGRYRRTA